MELKQLKQAIKELNDSGLLDEKLGSMGKPAELEKAFLAAVQRIPADREDEIPDLVVDVNNALLDDPVKEPTPSPAPTPAPATKKTVVKGADKGKAKAKVKAKVEKPKEKEKEKTTPSPSPKKKAETKASLVKRGKEKKDDQAGGKKSIFNHRLDRQSGQIDQLLSGKGTTVLNVMETLKVSRSRVTGHIKHLKKLGFKVVEKGDDHVSVAIE